MTYASPDAFSVMHSAMIMANLPSILWCIHLLFCGVDNRPEPCFSCLHCAATLYRTAVGSSSLHWYSWETRPVRF